VTTLRGGSLGYAEIVAVKVFVVLCLSFSTTSEEQIHIIISLLLDV
jgi:hypothetical protein